MMKQFSFFLIGLLLIVLTGCHQAKTVIVPSGWQSYEIVKDTATVTFALPPDFNSVNYFLQDSSQLQPGIQPYYFYNLGFISKDFELIAALNTPRESGLLFIKTENWGKDAPYTKRKIAGREFWIREERTYSANFSNPEDAMTYYLDYLDAGDNHLHIGIYCYETKSNKRKAKRLIKRIAKTIDIQVRGSQKTVN